MNVKDLRSLSYLWYCSNVNILSLRSTSSISVITYTGASTLSQCALMEWELTLHLDANGVAQQGDKQALRDILKSGANVKVFIPEKDLVIESNIIRSALDTICVQSRATATRQNQQTRLTSQPIWTFYLICTKTSNQLTTLKVNIGGEEQNRSSESVSTK